MTAWVILCTVFCLSFGLGPCQDSLDTLRSKYCWHLGWAQFSAFSGSHFSCSYFFFFFLHSIKPFAQPPYTTLPTSHPAPISRFGLFALWLGNRSVFQLSSLFACLAGYEPMSPPRPAAITAPVWQDRTIASSKLRLMEYSAFLETQKDRETVRTTSCLYTKIFLHTRQSECTFTLFPSPSFLQYKHLFVHIGPSNPSYSDPVLESIDVRQIYDKFSEKKGGLKELYEKGPCNAFFLVKFWVSTQNQFPLHHWSLIQ